MKKFFKFIFTASLMAGSGFVGYILAKKKYSLLADKEVENVKTKLQEYYEGKQENKQPVEEPKTECKKEEPKIATKDGSVVKNPKTEDQYVNYSKQYVTDTVERKLEAREEVSKNERPSGLPYVISASEYENSNFIAKSLYYYTEEGILTDSDGRHIDEKSDLIGDDALELLAKGSEDIVYVRNERIEADFEVIVIFGSIYNVAPKDRIIPEEYEK